MAVVNGNSGSAFTILCIRCDRPLTARREWIGREVQCPHCASVLRVPPMPPDGRPVRGEAPGLGARYRFNFGCPRCRTLLEAHTGLCGQPGSCPTCAARLIVPQLDLATGMPQGAVLLDTDDQNPVPLHAYAASGTQAPRIVRLEDGSLAITCPRCGAQCQVDANSCSACGAPFTIDAAPTTTSSSSDSWGATSLALGVVSLPLFFVLLPAGLAVFFAFLSLRLGAGRPASRTALAGLVLGLIALGGGVAYWLFA